MARKWDATQSRVLLYRESMLPTGEIVGIEFEILSTQEEATKFKGDRNCANASPYFETVHTVRRDRA